MKDNDVRELIVDTLVFAGAVESMGREATLANLQDLEELDLDSLAVMELCVGIEAATGVALAPEDIAAHSAIDALIRLVLKNRR